MTTISGLSEKFPIKSPRKRLGSDPGVKVTPPVIWKQYNMTDKDVGGKTSTSQVLQHLRMQSSDLKIPVRFKCLRYSRNQVSSHWSERYVVETRDNINH